MHQLSPDQQTLLSSLVTRLGEVAGVGAVVLGGSHARGRARPESDIDIGIFYEENNPFSIDSIRALAHEINDTPHPNVTDFYGWGPWVNGGAWLTIRGQRVDFIYRCLQHVERVIRDAQAGRYETDYSQQPPFGFFGPTYMGEVEICIPLYDPEGHVNVLKKCVSPYPENLRRAVIADYLWQAEFALAAFTRKVAIRGDAYGTAACLTRVVNQLALALFALNGKYPINDKTVLAEISEFPYAPVEFELNVQQSLSRLGTTSEELEASVQNVERLFQQTVHLAGHLYRPKFTFPT